MPLSVKNLQKTAFHAHFFACSLKLAFSTVVAASQSNGLFFTLMGSAPRCESVPFLMVRSGRRYAPRRLQGRTRWGVIPFGTEPFFLLPPRGGVHTISLLKKKNVGSRKKDSQALLTDAACCLRRHIARVRNEGKWRRQSEGLSKPFVYCPGGDP